MRDAAAVMRSTALPSTALAPGAQLPDDADIDTQLNTMASVMNGWYDRMREKHRSGARTAQNNVDECNFFSSLALAVGVGAKDESLPIEHFKRILSRSYTLI